MSARSCAGLGANILRRADDVAPRRWLRCWLRCQLWADEAGSTTAEEGVDADIAVGVLPRSIFRVAEEEEDVEEDEEEEEVVMVVDSPASRELTTFDRRLCFDTQAYVSSGVRYVRTFVFGSEIGGSVATYTERYRAATMDGCVMRSGMVCWSYGSSSSSAHSWLLMAEQDGTWVGYEGIRRVCIRGGLCMHTCRNPLPALTPPLQRGCGSGLGAAQGPSMECC